MTKPRTLPGLVVAFSVDALGGGTPWIAAKMQVNRKQDSHENQLPLPLQFAPPKVVRYGLRDAHPWPFVSDGKLRDGSFPGMHRVPASEAWAYRGYCQVEQNLPVLRKDSAGSETENQ